MSLLSHTDIDGSSLAAAMLHALKSLAQAAARICKTLKAYTIFIDDIKPSKHSKKSKQTWYVPRRARVAGGQNFWIYGERTQWLMGVSDDKIMIKRCMLI